MSLGLYIESIHDADAAIKRGDNSSSIYMIRGGAKVSTVMHLADGIRDLDRAISLDPKNASAHIHRGRGLLYLDRISDALLDLNVALELHSGDASWFGLRGLAYVKIGNPEAAIADFNQAEEGGLKDNFLYYRRGLAYAMTRDFAKAEADAIRAIRLRPSDAGQLFLRSAIRYALSRADDAEADYKAVQDQNPDLAAAFPHPSKLPFKELAAVRLRHMAEGSDVIEVQTQFPRKKPVIIPPVPELRFEPIVPLPPTGKFCVVGQPCD
jgi:tetratricopeptide (TPR) repeat protein